MKIKLFETVKALMPLILLFSCSSISDFEGLNHKSLRLPYPPIEYKKIINNKEFNEDIKFLRYAITKGYGAKGTTSENIFNSVDKKLRNLTFESSSKKLCENIGHVLSEFPDHHLKVKYKGNWCITKNVKTSNVGSNLNDSKKPWKGLIKKDQTYIIAIKKFTPGKWPGFHKFVDKALKNAKRIIIDLRNNGGGDDSIGFELAEKLAGQKIETPIAPDVRRNTPETLVIWENRLTVLKRNSNNKNMIEKLDFYLKENTVLLSKAKAGEIEEFTTKPLKKSSWVYNPEKGFQGKIYLLQNKRCGSSCESTIDFFEYFPNVKRVGTNTSGTIHFGNIGIIVLPNSGVQINIPSKANKYKDGRFIEFVGIKPDIILKDGQDALEHVLSLGI